ncbi:ACT domain-containing protein [Clostridium sp. C105KSO13]|uniref:ACT domain-containing protein n=1 Tax=Clostridium sp. C105KSO13 TaxID=1776045 RepID=UPI00074084F7|nr:ACT domain protein [Clostridium sp. C105KSO13]
MEMLAFLLGSLLVGIKAGDTMIKQLSIFVENRPGSIMRVTSELNSAWVNIRAIASFDTPEFAILRLVVDQTAKAKEYLTAKGFVVKVHDVIGVELKDKKGNLNNMLSVLAEGGININYIYSFVIREGKAPVMVFNTDNYEKAWRVLRAAGIKLIEESEL